MRKSLLVCGVLTASFGLVGCRSSSSRSSPVAGKCDCTNHPESAVIVPPGNPYPVIGGPATGVPASVAPSGVMGGNAPMAMPAPERLPAVTPK